jgi:hypothetical protein
MEPRGAKQMGYELEKDPALKALQQFFSNCRVELELVAIKVKLIGMAADALKTSKVPLAKIAKDSRVSVQYLKKLKEARPGPATIDELVLISFAAGTKIRFELG